MGYVSFLEDNIISNDSFKFSMIFHCKLFCIVQNLQGRDRRAMEEDVTKAIREHRKSREEEERKVQERLLGYPRMDAMVDVK